MQEEYTYIALFVLVGVFVLLTGIRLIRAAGNAIGQLRFESERDRYQHRRIAAEKNRQFAALKQVSRKINGKPRKVHWNDGDRRAHREYHLEDVADEVFDVTTDFNGMDVRTPWGWPSSSGKRVNPVVRTRKPAKKSGIGNSVRNFFKTKTVVDEEYRARQRRSMRVMVEDRYGRAGHGFSASEVEWSKPELPPALVRERQSNRIYASKSNQDSEYGLIDAGSLRLVSDRTGTIVEKRKASGE